MVNKIAFRAKKWTEWIDSLEYGPNIAVFKTLGDLQSAKSIATYGNTKDDIPFRIAIHVHKPQLVANFIKLPKDDAKRQMTQHDAVLIEQIRFMPPESVTPELLNRFDTDTGLNKAKTIIALNQGKKLIDKLGSR